jgi:hypothetical protein
MLDSAPRCDHCTRMSEAVRKRQTRAQEEERADAARRAAQQGAAAGEAQPFFSRREAEIADELEKTKAQVAAVTLELTNLQAAQLAPAALTEATNKLQLATLHGVRCRLASIPESIPLRCFVCPDTAVHVWLIPGSDGGGARG